MDSLLTLAVIILFYWLIFKSGKKSKKGEKSRPDAAPKAQPAATKAFDMQKAVEAFLNDPATGQLKAAAAQAAQMAAQRAEARQMEMSLTEEEEPEEYFMGQSFFDDEGCVGGSLGGHDEEGESRAEHEEHLSRADARQNPQTAAPRPRIRAAELRRAVVMSEILDKPKALRNYRI